jgi:hypothetical protein
MSLVFVGMMLSAGRYAALILKAWGGMDKKTRGSSWQQNEICGSSDWACLVSRPNSVDTGGINGSDIQTVGFGRTVPLQPL